ncbi:4'-phosphopantetheinyl transferase superfamily protein [Staphylococcus sp. GSSP0090]|nr:4'-phosphopantetheinyl transferase superfamily protein [Staphylococcus sp. GSSP0090]
MYIIITSIEDSITQDLLDLITHPWKEKRTPIPYRFESDALMHKIGDIVVQYGLLKFFGVKPNQWEYIFSELGKPHIVYDKELFFNLSYAYPYIVCAFDKLPIGVDIEKKRVIDFDGIISNFTINEQYYIKESGSLISAFYDIWTRKESYVKLMGVGLNEVLDSFDVLTPLSHEQNICQFHKYSNKDFIINACTYKRAKPMLVKLNLLNDILKHYI